MDKERFFVESVFFRNCERYMYIDRPGWEDIVAAMGFNRNQALLLLETIIVLFITSLLVSKL